MSRTTGTRSRTSGGASRAFPKNSGSATGTKYVEAFFRGFTGLNNKFSVLEIADTESPDCMNVEFDALGAIQKRNGYTEVTSMSSAITSILPFFTNNVNQLLLTYGTSIKQYDPIANTSTVVTSSLHGNGQRFSSAMDTVHNKIYMVNGDATDGLMSWDGTTLTKAISTVGGLTPQGKYTIWYKNHLFVAGDSTTPNRLYISDQGDPTTWPNLNFIDFDEGLGGITGMAQLGDSIVVFKINRVFVLKGSDPSSYTVVDAFSGEQGTVSHWSIVRIPNGLMYLARDGVYLFNGKSFELMTMKIDPSNWNQAHLDQAVAVEHDHKYWISLPEGTGNANNVTYVYSYRYNWWTKHSIAMEACQRYFGNTLAPTPYFTDGLGNMYQLDDGDTDNGNGIDAYFVTKPYDFGAPAHKKMFRRVLALALAEPGQYKLNLSFIEDFGVNSKWTQMPLSYTSPTNWGSFNWGAANWGGTGNIAHLSTNVPGMCRHIQFKIENGDKHAPFTFLGLACQYMIREQVQ